ncbi:hypothetical protein VTO42DRAFT_4308 [Malbranchea cinnamomea]
MMRNHFTNYISYLNAPRNNSRVGHLDFASSTIQPLSFASGTPIRDLYEVIGVEASSIVAGGDKASLSPVRMFPSLSGRDVFAVDKTYKERVREVKQTGRDGSDKVDSLVYEGEIGVIIGKAGFGIPENRAMEHVWGYTIVSNVTAIERQRRHKQVHMGKPRDIYCSIMGPIAVPAKCLPEIPEVITKVNGEPKQKETIQDLIFSISRLISTISEGVTIQPGDVLSTGTPPAVGIGQSPVCLKPGDEVEISVTQVGSLKNKQSNHKYEKRKVIG